MRLFRKLFFLTATVTLLISLLTINSFAACSHTSLGPQFSDAAHPHEQFSYCNLCGEKIYFGTYVEKDHGDGSWGSGTCPDCGSHDFEGLSCDEAGYCICGAAVSAYGHTFYHEIYYEVEHPHWSFRACLQCDAKSYTGDTITKNHGDGSWGSGTCPDCGSHSFSPGTCTSLGECVCGALDPNPSHSPGTVTYYENTHPHSDFRMCTACGTKLYLGTSTILSHGNGTSGTCEDCGTHSYTTMLPQQREHPHALVSMCDCGDSYTIYSIDKSCSYCTVNQTTVSSTASVPTVFVYFDGDSTIGIPILVPFDLHISYTNTYNHPYPDWGDNPNYPVFNSFSSVVTLWAEGLSYEAPPLILSPTVTENYYDSYGNLLRANGLIFDNNGGASSLGCAIQHANPSYAVAAGGGSILGGVKLDSDDGVAHQPISTTVYFVH